ncbi:MAG: hypothetical protein JW940_13775 [Polyangiaceae bacterium]|nr:hypothetical protein [Polyangiaceae bacterium]
MKLTAGKENATFLEGEQVALLGLSRPNGTRALEQACTLCQSKHGKAPRLGGRPTASHRR